MKRGKAACAFFAGFSNLSKLPVLREDLGFSLPIFLFFLFLGEQGEDLDVSHDEIVIFGNTMANRRKFII